MAETLLTRGSNRIEFPVEASRYEAYFLLELIRDGNALVGSETEANLKHIVRCGYRHGKDPFWFVIVIAEELNPDTSQLLMGCTRVEPIFVF